MAPSIKFKIPIILRKFFIVFLVILSLSVGFFIRIHQPKTALTNNVVAYYYDRASRLINNGAFSPFDQWGFAPLSYPENIPPLLAYITFLIYRLTRFVSDVSFNAQNFILFFPVLLYIAWAILVLLIFRSFFSEKSSPFIGFLIFVFSPISILLTSFGRYTEEALGLFFFFLCFWLFLKRNEGLRFYIFLNIFLTALVLTWQQFHIFFAAMAIAMIIDAILKANKISKRKVLQGLSLFVIPLILGHFISCYFFKISYSPIQMLKEFWIGIKDFNSEYLLMAMKRRDWAGLSLDNSLKNTGLLFAFLMILGMLRALFDWKKQKYRYIAIFHGTALLLAFKFSKNTAMILPFGIYVAAIGWESLVEQWSPPIYRWARIPLNYIRKFWFFLTNAPEKRKRFFVFFAFLILLGTAIIFSFLILKTRLYQKPIAQTIWVEKPSQLEEKASARSKIIIKNIGGDSLTTSGTTAGIHIELKNAEALNILGRQRGKLIYPSFKKDYRRGNVFWFEVVFKPLLKNEEVSVEFDAKKTEEGQVTILYRSWLPGSCPIELQQEAVKDLVGKFSNLKIGGWRNEKCIIRDPANDEKDYTYCLVEVFAAHKKPQYYRCRMLSI